MDWIGGNWGWRSWVGGNWLWKLSDGLDWRELGLEELGWRELGLLGVGLEGGGVIINKREKIRKDNVSVRLHILYVSKSTMI